MQRLFNSPLMALDMLQRDGSPTGKVMGVDVANHIDDTTLPLGQKHTLQCWIDSCYATDRHPSFRALHSPTCSRHHELVLRQAPSWIYLECYQFIVSVATLEIESLEGTHTYNLQSIIYVSNNHVTARIIVSGTLYTYDDTVRSGKCIKECSWEEKCSNIHSLKGLTQLYGIAAHIYIYSRVE